MVNKDAATITISSIIKVAIILKVSDIFSDFKSSLFFQTSIISNNLEIIKTITPKINPK